MPATGSAEVHVLNNGYVGLPGDDERVSGTVTRIHDHWAVYEADRWVDRDADGVLLSPSVRLVRTPGHTSEDISTVASTPEGVYACTHAWWTADGPEDDPLGTDAASLKASRELLLSFATVIIPGHGAPFSPGARS